jgi:hypothetical protein
MDVDIICSESDKGKPSLKIIGVKVESYLHCLVVGIDTYRNKFGRVEVPI